MPYRLTLNPDSKRPEVIDLAAFLGADDAHTITEVVRYLTAEDNTGNRTRNVPFVLVWLEPVTGPDPRD